MRTHYANGNALKYASLCDACDPTIVEGLYQHDPICVCAWQDETYHCARCGREFYAETRYDEFCSRACEDGEFD